MDLSTQKHFLFIGCFFAAVGADLIYVRLLRTIHLTRFDDAGPACKRISAAILLLLILWSSCMMSVNPLWNGEKPEHRDQYERLAESFLSGHLYLDYGPIDPKLLELENPYDPVLRQSLGVDYRWDHAFYNGHYYMYFGVVPVLLVFLPFRAITGMNLTSYHATQLFVAGFFLGIFLLFQMLARLFFKSLSFAAWLMLCITFCFISLWNCIACPALYNTAVSSALCMMIWALYFYFKAVWDTEDPVKALRLSFFGAVFGALAFGCRPPIALGNLFALPLLVAFLKRHRLDKKLFLRLLAVFLPYAITAAGLMWYNNARFHSPFEFGQSYQLTVADQSRYASRSILDLNWVSLSNGLIYNFFQSPELKYEFPFFSSGGVFLVYPILCYIFLSVADERARNSILEKKLLGFTLSVALCPVLITVIDILWAPFLTESYRQDILWLLCILDFLMIGLYYEKKENKLCASRWICRWCIWSLMVGFMLFADYLLRME